MPHTPKKAYTAKQVLTCMSVECCAVVQNLGHKGPTPTTICKASEIINDLRRWKRREAFRRSASAKGYSKEDVEEMEAYMATHGMWD